MSTTTQTIAVRTALYALATEISDLIPASPEPTEALLEDVIRLLRNGVADRVRLAEGAIERLTTRGSAPVCTRCIAPPSTSSPSCTPNSVG